MSVLTQVLQPLHVRAGDDAEADVVVLRQVPGPDEVAAIRAHANPVICAHSPELLTPFGIPTLTAPFVLATWLFLLPRQHFGPAAEPADAG